jgi:8-oxo-dGTP pyrophosphatase MutT (NUDIX family)
MSDRALRSAIWLWQRSPNALRYAAVRCKSSPYRIGAMAYVTDDERVLFVRQSYRDGWTLPGGMTARGEDVVACAVRETMEEVGLRIVAVSEPAVAIVTRRRRIETITPCRVAPGADPDAVRATSPEIESVRWFPSGALPPMQSSTATALLALARRLRTDER